MSESDSDQKKNSQLAATLFMEVPPQPRAPAQQQPLAIPVSPTPCITMQKISEPVTEKQTVSAEAGRPVQSSTLLVFLKNSAHEHPFLFGLTATIILVSIASIPIVLYSKL